MQVSSGRRAPSWVWLSGIVGAGAALSLPGTSGTSAAAASLLAVGALALLAGHAWGLLVAIPAHITLVGRLWPELVHTMDHGAWSATAIAVVVITALPALALATGVLPALASHLLPDRTGRTRAVFVAGTATALAAALVLPACL